MGNKVKKHLRRVYNTISETFDFSGTLEQCEKYFRKHDHGHLEITV